MFSTSDLFVAVLFLIPMAVKLWHDEHINTKRVDESDAIIKVSGAVIFSVVVFVTNYILSAWMVEAFISQASVFDNVPATAIILALFVAMSFICATVWMNVSYGIRSIKTRKKIKSGEETDAPTSSPWTAVFYDRTTFPEVSDNLSTGNQVVTITQNGVRKSGVVGLYSDRIDKVLALRYGAEIEELMEHNPELFSDILLEYIDL